VQVSGSNCQPQRDYQIQATLNADRPREKKVIRDQPSISVPKFRQWRQNLKLIRKPATGGIVFSKPNSLQQVKAHQLESQVRKRTPPTTAKCIEPEVAIALKTHFTRSKPHR
jgi:hypothetical protein